MDYAQLLAQHDHPIYWECPPGFDHEAAIARFARFLAALSAVLGESIPSETGCHIQDASFHSQAFLPLASGQRGLIRFSDFGDMATICDDVPIPEPTMKAVLEQLARHGYVYVPATVLHAPYTGGNPGVTGISSWWIRFFDWV
mgnify:CR=1 FL=1